METQETPHILVIQLQAVPLTQRFWLVAARGPWRCRAVPARVPWVQQMETYRFRARPCSLGPTDPTALPEPLVLAVLVPGRLAGLTEVPVVPLRLPIRMATRDSRRVVAAPVPSRAVMPVPGAQVLLARFRFLTQCPL